MRIIDMYAKDVTVVFEMELSELKLLHKAMNMMEINYDSTIPEEREAENFLTKRFYPLINELIEKASEKEHGT